MGLFDVLMPLAALVLLALLLLQGREQTREMMRLDAALETVRTAIARLETECDRLANQYVEHDEALGRLHTRSRLGAHLHPPAERTTP